MNELSKACIYEANNSMQSAINFLNKELEKIRAGKKGQLSDDGRDIIKRVEDILTQECIDYVLFAKMYNFGSKIPKEKKIDLNDTFRFSLHVGNHNERPKIMYCLKCKAKI